MLEHPNTIITSERWKRASAFKRQVYCALEDIWRGNTVARVAGVLLFVLIVLNALLVFVQASPAVTEAANMVMLAFCFASALCFAVEYLARLWIADLTHPDTTPLRARLRYAFSPMGLVDFLAFAPGLLVMVVPVAPSTLNAARIIRLIRLIKLSRYMRGLRSLSRVLHKRRSEIIAAFTVLGLLAVTASVLMYELENPVQPDKFDSVLTGMYWAMTTITSTGYGDLVPITPAGRLVGFATMVLSIAVVAIPAGIFSAGFVEEFRSQDDRARIRAAAEQDGEEEIEREDASL